MTACRASDIVVGSQKRRLNFLFAGWYGVIGSPAMSKELVIKLNAFITKVVSTPEMKAAFFKQGLEPAATTPEQFGQLMQREVQQNSRLAREAGIGKE